jgi:hypothetical protein
VYSAEAFLSSGVRERHVSWRVSNEESGFVACAMRYWRWYEDATDTDVDKIEETHFLL